MCEPSLINSKTVNCKVNLLVFKTFTSNCTFTFSDATPQSITPAKKYSHIHHTKNKDAKGGGITIATARYSSEDAASLVAFVVAIIEYTRLCAPLKEAQKKLSELEREKEDLILKETQSRVVSI